MPPSNVWEDAAHRGTLVLRDDCLMLDSGGEFWIPVFLEGRDSWNGEALVSDGRVFPLGSELVLGGAEFQDMPQVLKDLFVPSECPNSEDQRYWGVGGQDILLASEYELDTP
jgi:hypothetical protein